MKKDVRTDNERRAANNEACRRYRKRRRAKVNKAKELLEEDKPLTYNQLHYRRYRDSYIENALRYKEENPIPPEATKEYNRRYRERQRELLRSANRE